MLSSCWLTSENRVYAWVQALGKTSLYLPEAFTGIQGEGSTLTLTRPGAIPPPLALLPEEDAPERAEEAPPQQRLRQASSFSTASEVTRTAWQEGPPRATLLRTRAASSAPGTDRGRQTEGGEVSGR